VSCINKYNAYLDSVVLKINGEDASLVIEKVKNAITGADGFIETMYDRAMMNGFMKYYRLLYQANEGFILDVTLTNGEHIVDRFSKTNTPEPKIKYFPAEQKPFTIRKINEKTAYLSLTTFELLQKDEDEIRNFIKCISDSDFKNLIIDLRFNLGGSGSVASNLFSLFANKPFNWGTYNMVNKNDTYDFFKYTSNYSNTDGIFLDYKPMTGKNGYYMYTESDNKPNDSVHFGGTIYVLINEYSLSAATLFAGWMMSHNRGIIVGRETGSTFYQLNAGKFAQVMLGETGLELYMPLVKNVYTEEPNSRIPWGRGVIPDYIVKPTVDEAYQKDDKILNFTLDLIKKTQ
jgi:C-terminal processing protease CtpA/Prc